MSPPGDTSFRSPYNNGRGGRGGPRSFQNNQRHPNPSSFNGQNGHSGAVYSASADSVDQHPSKEDSLLFPHRRQQHQKDRYSNNHSQESRNPNRPDNRGRGGINSSTNANSHQQNSYQSPFRHSPSPTNSSYANSFSPPESKHNNGRFIAQNGSDLVRSDSSSSSINMGLHVMSGAAPGLGLDVMAFLREYRALECSCCNKLVGFQHRVTQKMLCQPDCHGQASLDTTHLMHVSPSVSSPPFAAPTLVNDVPRDSSGFDQSNVIKKSPFERTEETRAETMKVKVSQPSKPNFQTPPKAAREEDTSYRHTSSLHKYDAPQKHDTPPFKQTFDAVDNTDAPPPRATQNTVNYSRGAQAPPSRANGDVVDHKAAPQRSSHGHVNNAVATKQAAPFSTSLPPARKQEAEDSSSGMRPAEAIRKDVNPFQAFTGFVPPKVVAASVTKTAKLQNERTDEEKTGHSVPKPSPKEMPTPKVNQQVKVATEPAPAPVQKKPAPGSNVPQGKYNWLRCRYSSNLYDGADVKVSFVWGLNKYQVTADKDDGKLAAFQEKVQNFVKQSKPISRPPVVDEVLFGFYQEDYYRGRVMEVKDGKAKLVFIDFGDQDWNNFSDLYEPDDELMEHPIYSAFIVLADVPAVLPKVKTPSALSALVFSDLKLELLEDLGIRHELEYSGRLWTSEVQHLSTLILELINKEGKKNGGGD